MFIASRTSMFNEATQAHEQTAISTALHRLKICKRFVDDVYSILKRTNEKPFPSHLH